MADSTLVPTQSVQGGVASNPTAMAIGTNFIVRNDGRVLLHFIKTGAGNANITIVTPKTVSGLAVAELVIVVPATTGIVFAGPFNPDTFNDGSGDMDVSTDEDTGITIEAVQI